MGSGEESTPSKSSKPAPSTQEAPLMPTTPAYPDWSSSMQAFYGAGAAPPFFASTVASPTPHPYMWGGQHPMMPPYGTPVPYPALYPPGGMYAHPNMAMAPVTVHGASELDGRGTEGKERASSKKPKGTSGNHGPIVGKTDGRKTASGSGNDVGTQSAESGSDGSSDASDDNNNQGFSATKKGSFEQMLAEGANAHNNSVPGNPVVSVLATNLNMGMDLWNGSAAGSGPAMKLRANPPGMVNDQWVQQDERELKRQKRKQSNRESARRSRLRKQAECEELQQKVEVLSNENHTLRDEMKRLSEECQKLTSENNYIKEELIRLCGPEAVSKLENGDSGTHVESRGREDEGN